MKTVTIKDVAKKAGVSLATVSRTLSGKDPVRPETRERVMTAIKELNYSPNAFARQLRTQHTNNVVVIVPDIGNSIYHKFIRGVEAEASQNGYQILIADVKGQPDIEKYYFKAIQERAVDGIISASASIAEKILNQIAKDYPLIMAMQQIPNMTVSSVTIDNMTASREITTHIIRLGHKTIAYISSNQNLLLYQDRLIGYQNALENHGIRFDKNLVRFDEPSIQGGYKCMCQLLDSEKNITAVVTAGDTMAIGAMRAIQEYGMKVPDDIAVVGFDDIEISSYWTPALTTIRQPVYQIGQRSFQRLLNMINTGNISGSKDIIPHELIIRKSCGYLKSDNSLDCFP